MQQIMEGADGRGAEVLCFNEMTSCMPSGAPLKVVMCESGNLTAPEMDFIAEGSSIHSLRTHFVLCFLDSFAKVTACSVASDGEGCTVQCDNWDAYL
jgi:hypothetical protein